MKGTVVMKPAQEYKILPQIEEDNFYIKDRRKQGWFYCCVGLLIVLLFIGIGASVVVLCGWTDDLYKALKDYTEGIHNATESLGGLTGLGKGPSNVTVMPGNSSESTEEYYYYTTSGELGGNWTTVSAEVNDSSTSKMATTEAPSGIDKDNVGQKFAETMRHLEKSLEHLTGIHQAELVIPLFMIIILMATLFFISLTCCIMTKQREKKQRKLLGKIITDLHTGDSKTVLLERDDDI